MLHRLYLQRSTTSINYLSQKQNTNIVSLNRIPPGPEETGSCGDSDEKCRLGMAKLQIFSNLIYESFRCFPTLIRSNQ
jgi:hypothetical protein